MSALNIVIDKGFAEVSYQKGKRRHSKVVTLTDFVSTLLSEQGLKTPLLPFGTRAYLREEGYHIVLVEFQALTRPICYKNNAGKMIFSGSVPMPWGLFRIKLSQGQDGSVIFVSGNIYALKRPILSPNDELFYFPVPNIHSDCSICWGSTFSSDSGFKMTGIHEAGKVIDMFFSSDFNTDITPRFNMYRRYEDLLRDLHEKQKFDYTILSSTGKTFADLL